MKHRSRIITACLPLIVRYGKRLTVALLAVGLGAHSGMAQNNVVTNSGPANIRSILLFPIGNDVGPSASSVGPMIDDAVRLRLASVNKFKVIRFSRLLPSVQRGLDDRDLSEEDVAVPFADDDKDQARAAKIAQRVDVDAYFIGNVEGYKVDASTKAVTIQITGNLYYTDSGISAQSIGGSATAKPTAVTDQLSMVIQSAVDDSAGQIASGIDGVPLPGATVVAQSQRGHAASSGGSVLLALLGGALLYAAFHHDSSSSSSAPSTGTGGGGGLTPPPPPFVVRR